MNWEEEHTADIAFLANGRNEKELLENAIERFLDIFRRQNSSVPFPGTKNEKWFLVEENAYALEDVIIYLLDSILSKLDYLNGFPTGFRVDYLKHEESKWKAKVRVGYVENSKGYRYHIKAVTLHNIELKKSKTEFSLKIVLDV